MLPALAAIVLLAGIVVALWLAWSAMQQIKQLRGELDQTQRHVNDLEHELGETRQAVTDLTAAAQVVPAPPPLPRTRSSGLEDLREQLRAAHREDAPSEE